MVAEIKAVSPILHLEALEKFKDYVNAHIVPFWYSFCGGSTVQTKLLDLSLSTL
jgi:hypothetical protein